MFPEVDGDEPIWLLTVSVFPAVAAWVGILLYFSLIRDV